MEIEQSGERVRVGVGHVNKVGYMKRVTAKKRKPYRRVLKKPIPSVPIPRALQELFHSCKQTFTGPDTVPSPQHVHKLRHILGMNMIIILYNNYFFGLILYGKI